MDESDFKKAKATTKWGGTLSPWDTDPAAKMKARTNEIPKEVQDR